MKFKRKSIGIMLFGLLVGMLMFTGNRSLVRASSERMVNQDFNPEEYTNEVPVKSYFVGREATTKHIFLNLSMELEDFEKSGLNFFDKSKAVVKTIRKPQKQEEKLDEHTYVLEIEVFEDGAEVGILPFFEIEGKKYKLVDENHKANGEIQFKVFKRSVLAVTEVKTEEEGGKTAKILFTLEKPIPYDDILKDGEAFLNFTDPNALLTPGYKVKASDSSVYRIEDLQPKKTGFLYFPEKTNFDENTNREDITFTFPNPAKKKIRLRTNTPTDQTRVQVQKLEAVPDVKTSKIILELQQGIPNLTVENLDFGTQNILEVKKVTPKNTENTEYEIEVMTKKAGAVFLDEIITKRPEYVFEFEDGAIHKEVKIKHPTPIYEEEEEALLAEEAKKSEEAKKAAEEKKKAEEAKKAEEEKKAEEAKKAEEKKSEEKKTEEKSEDVVVKVKRGKTLSVTVKKQAVKEALEKNETLVIKNKKQQLEIGAEALKSLAADGKDLKVTLKKTKAKLSALSGVKTKRVFDFKINNKRSRVDVPVKVTLNYKGKKLPKVYLVEKGGRLTELVGVTVDKTGKTVSFETNHIKKFVLAY